MTGTANTGRLAVLAAAVLFSTGGPAIKWTTLPGVQVAAFRSLIAALVLYALLPSWRGVTQRGTLRVGIAYAATLVLFVLATKWTTAASAIFLQSTAPLWVVLLSGPILGERPQRGDLVFAGVLAFGLGLFFVGADAPTQTAPAPLLGNLAAVVAGFSWCCAILGLRWLARTAPQAGEHDAAGSAVVVGNALAFAVCVPFLFPLSQIGHWGVVDASAVIYLGAIQIGLAYVLLTAGLRRIRAIDAALLVLLEPVLNALLTWALHGETPGTYALAGCGVILTATVVWNLRTLGSGQ